MNYRVGRKKQLALLDENGHRVAMFDKGNEKLAVKVCQLLNTDIASHPEAANEMIQCSECNSYFERKEIVIQGDIDTCDKCLSPA